MDTTPTPIEPRKRPERHDREVVARHMAAIRDAVRDYLVKEGDEAPDMDAAMKEIEHAMRFEVDGYRIARDLEDRGWSADSGLVDLMERLALDRYDVYRDVVAEWVAAEGIKPQHTVGDRVKARVGRDWKNRDGNLVDGEIVRVEAEQAEYVVFMESRGHVRQGKRNGTLGLMVAFEDVEPA